ncbi:hypothetical protein FUA23_11760 [Neolewinella aurantiaca]|uniref:histidine kinase n=1 Tax=Neolewinella aurantiaca TaxID=2602767 RepID=A0A5C7FDS9_9BACT|nr:sensor histidine kinase [Neolewinella aurantiaca]TXF89180.1 hypothetical protein FUA23_11760 [Neolewinella aurantiaca]
MPLSGLQSFRISPAKERSRVFRSVIIATLLLVVVLAAALATQAATGRSRQAVIKAMNLERSLHSLLSSVQDAETGQRGYLLTGDEQYLEPYISSLEATPEALAQLSKFIEAGKDQNRFHLLTLLIRRRYEELTATIGMRRAGDSLGAVSIVALDNGKAIMDSIRQEIEVLKQSEQAEVDAKIAVVQSLFNLDMVLRIIIFVGMFVILYFLYSRLRPLITHLENTLGEKESEIAIRRQAEKDKNNLIADLKDKNEDLDHFAYIASHDLQEPLRTVTNFIDIIEEDHGEVIGEDGKIYFGFIHEATDRMRIMIETLLRYSQLGRGSALTKVDLNNIVANVLQQLDAKISETKAKIIVHDLPVLNAYPIEITQVFQNLISNALKFVKKGESPHIEIFQVPNETSLLKIGVKDKGIGMNEAALGKIFQMFSRVNEAGSYSGHGIGLAFCRKILERHGGKISVISSPGQGTTFYLTLPKNLTPPK